MTSLPFFVAACPSCSTRKQLELSLLGRQADCISCGRTFQAVGADSSSAALDDPVHYWIHFTDHTEEPMDDYALHGKEIGRTPR